MGCGTLSHNEHILISPSIREISSEKKINYDFHIKFHGAHNLPKTDIIGIGDPYFRADIDDGKMKYVSTCVVNTSNPIWDEEWIIRNVPSTGKLSVKVYDKDNGSVADTYIGKFQTDLKPMEKECITIMGSLNSIRGVFELSVTVIPRSLDTLRLNPYTFDGPVRYSRHYSLAAGHLTQINNERLYSTWKIYLKRIDFYFDKNKKQKWNSSYQAAKSIFEGPMSYGMQAIIRQGHSLLYAKYTTDISGVLNSSENFWKLLLDPNTNTIKPCVYTYIIDDNAWRFSETGASFFIDMASKHALHANCAETVHYAGEFHPRPIGGWNVYDPNEILSWNQWEIVIDNGSGTYSPDSNLLGTLKDLLMFNFPNLNVATYDFKDSELKSSIEACRDFAKKPKPLSITTIKHLVSSPLLD